MHILSVGERQQQRTLAQMRRPHRNENGQWSLEGSHDQRAAAQDGENCETEMSDKLITLFSHYEEKVRQFHLGRIPVEMIDGPRNEIIARIKAAESKYVPQQSLLEAAKTAREVMRGKDLEHVWTNYPTEPAVTLGQMLDAAIRKCEPSAAE
jgi:hypothetical protein